MKKISVIALVTATVLLSSCSIFTILSGAKKAGTSVGKILTTIYDIFKSKGTSAFTDASTLSLIEELSKEVYTLKQNESDPVYLQHFAKGLVKGSTSLVNEGNASAVVNALLKLDGLSAYTAPEKKSTFESLVLAKELTELFRLFRE